MERFVTVGETIADDYQEVKGGMYEACKEARSAGHAIEKLCEDVDVCKDLCLGDKAALARAARCLLAAVTRVLLLADFVVVKQLLLAKDKVESLNFSFLISFVNLALVIAETKVLCPV